MRPKKRMTQSDLQIIHELIETKLENQKLKNEIEELKKQLETKNEK